VHLKFIGPAIALVILSGGLHRAHTADAPNPWEKAIQAFEEQDLKQKPEPGSVLFLGSSSIRMWNTAQAFPETKTINRGFGGSQVADAVNFADRIAIPYKPRMVVFYAGDNDIASGKSADQVLDDFKAFVKKILMQLPETRIAFIAIKPSPARWKHFETQKKANSLVEEFAKSDERLDYIDIVKPMLGDDGQPRGELFQKDNLHLNADGYELWTQTVKPYLRQK